MNDEKLKAVLGKNIASFRKLQRLTQAGLAEKLNYSDKTISKWERAESSPDISVLVEIANIFGVTVDYLVTEEHDEKPIIVKKKQEPSKYNRKAIAYISESAAWIVAVFSSIITTLIVTRLSFQLLYFVDHNLELIYELVILMMH